MLNLFPFVSKVLLLINTKHDNYCVRWKISSPKEQQNNDLLGPITNFKSKACVNTLE